MTTFTAKRRGHTSKNCKAFTLVEVLVVIAIIALLLGIITAAVTQARRKARRIVCSSNISQIYLAMVGYAARNDDQIIRAREILYVHSLEEALGCWNIALLPYIGKSASNNILENRAELWFCPEDKDPYPRGFKNCPHEGMTSYALNGYYEGATETAGEIKLGPAGNYTMSELTRPSECFLMGETSYAAQFYDADAPNIVAYNLRRDGHYRCTSGFYHDNSMNLLYADGHIANIKGRQSDELVWPEGFEQLYRAGKFMYWADLALPSADEEPAFWGPGY